MANFKPENVKRFVEDISKDVAKNAYNGGGSGGGWVPVKNRSSLTVHCLAIKQLLIDNNIDIEASAVGNVINIGATICKEYAPSGARPIQITVHWNSDINFQGILVGGEVVGTTWDLTEDQSVRPTINELLTKGGDVKTYFDVWPEGYVSFYLNLSIRNISSGHWIEIPSGEISKYFEIGEPEE